jgi:hypothetical protein
MKKIIISLLLMALASMLAITGCHESTTPATAPPVTDPGLVVTGWECSATHNGDHLPSPGEKVYISFVVKNNGPGPTSGPVTGTLSLNPASPVMATVSATNAIDEFGVVAIAEGASVSNDVGMIFTVDPAATPGSEILLDLSLADGANTWLRTIALTISAP